MYNVRTLVKILSPVAIILITTNLLRYSEERPEAGLRPQKTIKTKELLWLLTELALIPPEAPVNQTCRPPELREPTCGNETGFTGKIRSEKASIILMMLFSFEADTLEISLREIQDVVDHIFIVESSRTHRGQAKPLVWERLKFSARFDFVDRRKVHHIVADDLISEEWKMKGLFQWQAEVDQTDTGVMRIRAIFDNLGLVTEDVVFVSADVDEVMSRDTLRRLAWCELTGEVGWGGLWVPMGDLRRAVRVDNPSQHGPHLFPQPTIYSWPAVRSGRRAGRRMWERDWVERNNSATTPMVRGGIHLTAPAFLPTAMLKEMTATEEQFYKASLNFAYLFSAGLGDLWLEQQRLETFFYKPMYRGKSDNLSEAADIEPRLPWYLDCNRERFPYWFGKEEPRNRIIHDKLALFSAKHGIKPHKIFCPQLFEGARVSCFVNNSQLVS